jgi:hypothetical protein
MNLWIIIALANIPVYIGIAWVVFDSVERFDECLKFWLMPDLLSALRGEYWEDIGGELHMWWWIGLCAGAVYAEHWLLVRYALG